MTTQLTGPGFRPAPDTDALPRPARGPLALVGTVVLAVMLIGSRNYGHFFDEAYFIVAGRDHPAAGYFDQPPLVPMLAAALDHLAHGSLVVLRLPATLAVVAITLLAGLIARELGGRAWAQAFAAAAVAMSLVSSVGHWLVTYSLDPLWWTIILYLLVRWVRTRDDRLLLLAGAVTALSLLTKFLVPALWIAVAIGALACGPRRLVTRPALWAGGAIAVVAITPTLWWQAGHDWAYTRMGAVVRAEWPGGAEFALVGLFGAGLLIGLPLLVTGTAALLRSRDLRPYRFLGVALLLVVAAIVLTHGRAYYLASVYPLPMAAGAVVAERWLSRRGRLTHRILRAVAVIALLGSTASWIAGSPVWSPGTAERIGAPPLRAPASMLVDGDTLLQKLSGTVVAAYRTLPPADRDGAVIVAESYPFAAAVDFFGRDEGLPRAYSGHRAYYYFGRPPDDARTVLWIGEPSPVLDRAFTHRRAVPAPGDDADPVVQLYSGRTVAWPELWERLRSQ
ncbi:ArnT family glycosyltransferase [Tsukamurella paurometabola]|uniref:Glycosyltransferase family 39 protein n=1 Tax=Tsukamurella paurometabola TaxID=2061 RepID=A0A3P8L4K5_TSUPA|nr:glycosyltransferase family 39 protein [Tsukamurella paurometabola]MBS4104038.1 glycosyltransferase family 39 protein [Tsukamurella paurometabola]UEA83273.1 glycosyltransferase family 39 protein [Tsukamurella paurometabola]VDR40375.1 Predicted membrane protein [Tsukamurella paurometabola]